MTSRTLIPYGLLVNIKVAGCTIGFSLIEFQRGMTLPTVNHFMLTFQLKAGSVMLK